LHFHHELAREQAELNLLGLVLLVSGFAACTVYDDSLLEGWRRTDAGTGGNDAGAGAGGTGGTGDGGDSGGGEQDSGALDGSSGGAVGSEVEIEAAAGGSGGADTVDGSEPDADGAIAEAGCADSSTCAFVDLNPSKDAFVNGGSNAGTNYGTAVDLVVKGTGSVNYVRNTWLSFDLTGHTGIASAKLRLFVKSIDLNNTNVVRADLFISPTDSWGETTITWSTAPLPGAKIGSTTVTDATVNTWIEFDVTAAVQGETDGAVTFVMIGDLTDRAFRMGSREDVMKPVLRITTQ
jgi:hypothetical protein